jgi:hypothetical protein
VGTVHEIQLEVTTGFKERMWLDQSEKNPPPPPPHTHSNSLLPSPNICVADPNKGLAY